MYKLLIVDDEALVREAIQEGMDWERMGYVCLGACEDGIEALEFVEKERPDVILTDIGMPFMDGIELTQQLSVRYPDIKVIMLTGYDNFEYARQAVKMGVSDYVMKPITAAEMEELLRRVGEELDTELSHKRDYDRLKRQLNESMPLLKERFLERLATSSMTPKQIREGCEYFGIQWSGPWLIELAADVDEFILLHPASPSDDELFRFAIYNIAQEVASRHDGAETFRDRENRVLVLLAGPDREKLIDRAVRAAEEIHASITEFLPLKASVGIGHPCLGEDNLVLAHRTALSALDYRLVIGSDEIIRISDMERCYRPQLLTAVAWENELITRLKTGTPGEMNQWIRGVFSAFREQRFPIDICYIYLQRFLLTLMHTLYETGVDADQVFGSDGNPMEDIKRLVYLDEMEQWVKELCTKAIGVILSEREDHGISQIEKAIAYVREHYKNPELSLKTVSKHIAISATYFSTLFKSSAGKTFVEFLIEVRMEKAKELLKLTSMRSYEIAYEIGYRDPQYFSSAFKKYTGDTPTEFRARTVESGA